MQVATLFRETATLLGATMEATEGPGLKMPGYSDGSTMMKQEPHDDGYETSGDMEMRTQNEVSKIMGNHPNTNPPPLPHPHATHPHVHPHPHAHPHAHPHPHPHVHPHPHPHPHPHSHPHVHGHPHSHSIQGGSLIKYEMQEDPYSFVDEDQMNMQAVQCPPVVMQQVPKKRGRKKKIKIEDQQLQPVHGMGYPESHMMNPLQLKPLKDKVFKERKKHDRFNGMPEEEVSKRTLPDHLTQNLDIVIIGINPGLFAAYKGHHYAGPGNHFWKCLYLSGLTPEPMTADDDYKLLKVGIGFTNMVERATKGSADLTRKEIKEGSQILLEKLQKFKPKIAVFNGKLIFEVFSGKKDFSFGRQPELVDGTNTYMWVMPSSSARCAQLPRAADKVPFYAALKKFRDYLNGLVPELDEKEIVFTYSKLKNFFEPDVKEEPKDEQQIVCSNYNNNNNRLGDGLTDLSNAVIKKENGEMQPQQPQPPPEQQKKKRGRPKKIKVEGEVEQPSERREKPAKETDKDGNIVPKKKRGRPKKIKTDAPGIPPSEHSNPPSSHISTCFTPPIHSPINLCQQGFSQLYNNHNYNQNSSESPLSNHNYHQSPLQSHGYNQSPQPPSFTHSDLSSEISAAISSEHNLGSRSPDSPGLGPPDFEPPNTLQEETSKSPSIGDENNESHMECHFSSPPPSKKKSPDISYQSYDDFSGDSEGHTTTRYPQTSPSGYNPKSTINQDVSSKSLSGLESLVDQIPNIGDGETPHSVVGGEQMDGGSSGGGGQFSDDSAYLSDYPRVSHYSPQYSSSVPTTSNTYTSSTPSMNFSVTSLANSSATSNQDAPGSFSVSSLASNYNSGHPVTSYPSIMGPPHPMGGHVMDSFGGGLVDRTCRIGSAMDSSVGLNGVNMPSSSLPYPYSQYPSAYSGTPGPSFPYSPPHNIHVPSPNFPYPSPYSNAGYPQPGYLPNHVFDRIKSDRMDIGFGGF